ncbi:MAG TPA: hypothetical protein VFX03_02830 [Thermomicrobiales bacterium]|nr:hypothetical protein [Thermomicrobiales bacterium]
MRTAMIRAVFLAAPLLTVGGGAAAQEEQDRIDSAFSDTIVSTLGYPELAVTVGPEGIEAPASVTAGYHVVRLSAADDFIGYLDIVQTPAGLSEPEQVDQALAAGRDDMPQAGWIYFGGTNTPGVGDSASFIIRLEPGEYKLAASYYAEAEGSEEHMALAPLTVTEAPASPAASPVASAAPPASVTLAANDNLQYIVTPDAVPAGPQLWKIANTGEHHPHHVVMVRVPDGTTAPQIVQEFNAMISGTPAAGEPVFAKFVWVGYAALQSGGQTTWAEFDLKPATYAVVCFIIDEATGRPHAADGMVTVFSVK